MTLVKEEFIDRVPVSSLKSFMIFHLQYSTLGFYLYKELFLSTVYWTPFLWLWVNI